MPSEFFYFDFRIRCYHNPCLLLELGGSSIRLVILRMVRCLILEVSKDSRNKLGGIFNETFLGPKVWDVSDGCLMFNDYVDHSELVFTHGPVQAGSKFYKFCRPGE